MEQKMRKRVHRTSSKIIWILSTVILLGTMTACKGNGDVNSDAAIAESADAKESQNLAIDNFMNTYAYREENSSSGYQHDNYVIADVALVDPCEEATQLDILWEGYTEVELGMLSPDEMPNIFYEEYPCVMYNGNKYAWVNEYNLYNENGDSRFTELANVWVAYEIDEVTVLGGLEEYGRYCAKKGVSE